MSFLPRLRPLSFPSRVLLAIVLALVMGQVLSASFLPFKPRLPAALGKNIFLIHILTFGVSAIMLVASLFCRRIVSITYATFLFGLLLLTLGKDVRELIKNPNPLGTDHPLIYQPQDNSLHALMEVSNMYGSITYLAFYDHYNDYTLIAPETVLDTLALRPHRLVVWGGLKTVIPPWLQHHAYSRPSR